MLRIISHIENLLLKHDCVIVPDFGGFVLQAQSAIFNEKTNIFSPSSKEISFNINLQHNDGLLTESYMKTYSVDDIQAERMLMDDISLLKSQLHQFGKLSLEEIGNISVGKEGQWIFTPGNFNFFCTSSYGLAPFSIPLLSSLQQESLIMKPKSEVIRRQHTGYRRHDTYYIPVSRTLLRLVGATAAAIVLFLALSTPVKEVDKSSFTASLVPFEEDAHEAQSQATDSAALCTPSADSAVCEKPVAEQTAPEALTSKVEEKVSETATKERPQISGKKYHVVIASLPSTASAKAFIKNLDHNKFSDPGLVERDNKHRVYAAVFDNRTDAENYISQLRNEAQYKDAWLFICR